MKAIIMAGGEGSRLRPLTCDLPKPMAPVMNKPMMEHIINLLKQHGITEIGVTLMYLPQKIKDYFGDGSSLGVNLHYFIEDTPLGTAGSVKNAGDFLDDTFVVISGDASTNMDLTKAINFHKEKKSLATLVLYKVDVPLEYGVVVTNEDGLITRFLEKPSWGEVFSDTANTGTYILEPEVFDYFKKGDKFDFSMDLFPLLLKDKKPMYGYTATGYWNDIGDLRVYLQTHFDILDGKLKIEMPGTEIKPGVWVGTGTEIHPEAEINKPCIIGNNCRIGKGAVIENYSVIGNNVIVEEDVSIKKSIVWSGSTIQLGSELRGCILCSRVNLKNFVSVFENAVIGDDTVVNERAIIKPNVKVWPQKVIDNLAIVDRNIVWGAKFSKTIFGENGLSGIANIDISPEFTTRLGAAYGSTFKKGSKIVVSSTSSNSARMFKYAFISGLLSVGIEVFDLSELYTPVSRNAINFLSVSGGIHVKVADDNPNKICVDFMDKKGASIARSIEKKIENSFVREDFKRAPGSEINKINYMPDYKTYYITSLLNDVNESALKTRALKIVVSSPSDLVLNTASEMLRESGCNVIGLITSNKAVEEVIENVKFNIISNKYDFGAFVDGNGEKLTLIDSQGNVIEDDLLLTLNAAIVFRSVKNAKLISSITAPSVLEEIAQVHEGQVLRTKTSSQAIMEEILGSQMRKSKESTLQFLLNFDATAAVLKIAEFISVYDTTLVDILASLPRFNLIKKKVFCPWELKGTVMRMLMEKKDTSNIELLEGVKFHFKDGWALILPDADKPLVKIYAEGDTENIAEKLAEKYADEIQKIVGI